MDPHCHPCLTSGSGLPCAPADVIIFLGEHDKNNSSESQIQRKGVNVSKIIIHPNYSEFTFINDIALLKLSEEVDLNIYTPSCIAETSDNFAGQKAWVYGEKILIRITRHYHFIGWGYTNSSFSSPSDKLLEVEVSVVSNAVCQEAMKNFTNYNVSFKHKLYEFTTKIWDNWWHTVCWWWVEQGSLCGRKISVKYNSNQLFLT